MLRGELYLVQRWNSLDPRKQRAFVVASAQPLIDSGFSSVICAPLYSNWHGLSTQVPVGIDEGLKHDSCIYCDELISIPKKLLTRYVGHLPAEKITDLNRALAAALDLEIKE
jgi:mRNA interferase MazF